MLVAAAQNPYIRSGWHAAEGVALRRPHLTHFPAVVAAATAVVWAAVVVVGTAVVKLQL